MTNLSSNNKKRNLINPESSLLFTPILLGTVVLSLLLIFVFRPVMRKLSEEEAKIDLLQSKISFIPLYKQYINDLSKINTKAQQQQKRLIDLISDPNELETILTRINEICMRNSIEIINIAPQKVVNYNEKARNSSSNTLKDNINNDPFLIPSIEKHMFKLVLKGNFNNLINLLKELELLQTIAIFDDIEITATPRVQINNLGKDSINLVMKLNLSTYARIKSTKSKL